jgi:hypothetical protein
MAIGDILKYVKNRIILTSGKVRTDGSSTLTGTNQIIIGTDSAQSSANNIISIGGINNNYSNVNTTLISENTIYISPKIPIPNSVFQNVVFGDNYANPKSQFQFHLIPNIPTAVTNCSIAVGAYNKKLTASNGGLLSLNLKKNQSIRLSNGSNAYIIDTIDSDTQLTLLEGNPSSIIETGTLLITKEYHFGIYNKGLYNNDNICFWVNKYGEASGRVITATERFKLPKLTAAEASTLIAENADMIYVTDTNGTFTSIGFWGYENSLWIKL